MRRLWLELSVLTTLFVSFMTIPLEIPHLVSSGIWIALTGLHVYRRRNIYLSVLRRGQRARSVASTILVVLAVVVTVSGLVQWAGVLAAVPWHAGSSVLLMAVAAGHAARRLWRRRPPALRARSDGGTFALFDRPSNRASTSSGQ